MTQKETYRLMGVGGVLVVAAVFVAVGNGATVERSISSAAGGTNVITLTLINADTDKPVSGFDPMSNNATINLSQLTTRNLNVAANPSAKTGSVKFLYDGQVYSSDIKAPFSFAGDNSGNFNAWTPTVGTHTITAIPYTSTNTTKNPGVSTSITFTVTDPSAVTMRDEKKLNDIILLRSALASYYHDNNSFPTTAMGLPALATLGYIQSVPTPQSGGGCTAVTYPYVSSFPATYRLYFCLEANYAGYAAGNHTASESGIQ